MHNLIIPSLKHIPNPPRQIFIKGNQEIITNNSPKLAIVGTRKPTAQGLDTAYQMAKELAKEGFIIISGLALGIDQAAHRGCLAANGCTIAVLANGLDTIYPRQHEQLAKQIIDSGGTLISEYPAGTPPFPNQFLERNRIISGLSQAVLIIEAPLGSGAINTAHHALAQGRDVLVVPGAIHNKNYEGSNNLIKEGAALVSSTRDILDAFGLFSASRQLKTNQCSTNLSADQQQIIAALQTANQPLTMDKIIELTKLKASDISQNLTLLIIEGLVKEDKGKYYV